jgi:hypothetical protein
LTREWKHINPTLWAWEAYCDGKLWQPPPGTVT